MRRVHRNTVNRKSRVRCITGVAVAVLLLSGCIDQQTPSQKALTVSDFRGPPVGQTYIYAVDGKEILKVTATGKDSTGAVLEKGAKRKRGRRKRGRESLLTMQAPWRK